MAHGFMHHRAGFFGLLFSVLVTFSPVANAGAAGSAGHSDPCGADLTRQMPARSAAAAAGSAVAERVMDLSGETRDRIVIAELFAGNIPAFLRRLTPVTLSGSLPDGRDVDVTICVTPDYLAVGSDSDFVRMPMGLPAAAAAADRFGFLLPTPLMVDTIYAQASVRLTPSPMPPTSEMRSTGYLVRHNRTVDAQRAGAGPRLGALTAGQKKDLVLTNRLRSAPGRVAIYGWHRENGVPIQPLSTVHGAQYADYSHGVRLVSDIAYVDGVPRHLTEVLQTPRLAAIVSGEGPITETDGLLALLHNGWTVPGSPSPMIVAAAAASAGAPR